MDAAPFYQFDDCSDEPARAFWVKADDGVRLRLALWGDDEAARGTVLLFPGRTEYVEKYAPFARILTDAGYAVLAIDWRGQGLSDRLLDNPRTGHVGEFADYQRDVVEMILAATDLELPQPWHLLAHSMGGCIGLAAIYNDLPVETAVFSAPMWGLDLGPVPVGVIGGLARFSARLGLGARVVIGSGGAGTYVLDEAFAGNLLTGDPAEWGRMVNEAVAWPQVTLGGVSVDWLGKAIGECQRLSALPSPDLPMTVTLGSGERIVSASAIRDRAGRWDEARLLELDGARHEAMMETAPLRDAFAAAALQRFAGQ